MLKTAVLMGVTFLFASVAALPDFADPLPLQPSSDTHSLVLPQSFLKGSADVHLESPTSKHDPSWAKFASGTGNDVFLAVGSLLPLLEDGKEGKDHSLRAVDSLVTSALITEGLKTLTHEKRPDGSDYKSFPSGHATAAFALATMQASYHPKQALLWYAGATAIAASRVILHRHHVHDVIAGAAVGFFTSKLELKQKHGLLLFPFINGTSHNKAFGMSVGGSF